MAPRLTREEHEALRRLREREWRQLSLAKRREHEERKLMKRFGATDTEIERFYANDDDTDEIDEADTVEPSRRLLFVRDTDEPSKSPWKAIAIGLGVFAAITAAGVIVYLLLSRRRSYGLSDGSIQSPQQPIIITTPSQQPQVYLVNNGHAEAIGPADTNSDRTTSVLDRLERAISNFGSTGRLPREPYMQTVRLPSILDPNAQQIRCVSATDVPYEAVLRVVGGAGTYAIFTTVPGALDRPDIANVAVPTGDALIVPSGQFHTIRLSPKQAVFGKGSAANVLVSVTASEAVERVYG
jgi:hypothetical protein